MDKIAVLDFGGQYAHLIANRIRRLGVYSEILDGDTAVDQLSDYKGIILSGGPASVIAEGSLKCDKKLFELRIPVLGICYGHQLMAHSLGGKVDKGDVREYGSAEVEIINHVDVFEGLEDKEKVWMSHFDQVVKEPEGFGVCARTPDCPIAAMADNERKFYGVQFHPEVTHTPCGSTILDHFIRITGAAREWNIARYIDDITLEIREKVGDRKVFLLISGGVDSTVTFLLLDKALGQQNVYGLFVDTGFMRLNEGKEVYESLKGIGIENLHIYDAEDKYFDALQKVYDPEKKRKIIGDLFLDIQKEVSDKLDLNPEEWVIAQGTIYPDTIETGGTKHADKIKTHHNRVEKIQKLIEEGKVIEPIHQLYKDEVRLVGENLGLNSKMVWRHPFPGPGLAVRTLCAESRDYPEDVEKLEKDMNELIDKSGLKVKVLPIKSVGVQGDERTYRHPAALYGGELDWGLVSRLSTQLTNQYNDINRVVYCLEPGVIESLDTQNAYLERGRNLTIQKADKVVMDFIREMQIHSDIWQFPTVLIPVEVNGLGGESIVLRPVCSEEAMTANFYQMDLNLLSELVKRLRSLDGVNGIFYDITNKPPGTIEWE